MADGSLLGSGNDNNNGVTSLAFSPDQKQLAAGQVTAITNGSVRFFNLSNGRRSEHGWEDPNNGSSYVTSVAYAPSGNLFVYARADSLLIASFDPF